MSAAFLRCCDELKEVRLLKHVSRLQHPTSFHSDSVNLVDSVNDRKSRLSLILKYSEDKSALIEISVSPKPQVDQMH